MYVDLDVLRANAIVAAAGTPLCAVVKADAYGLGAVRVARLYDALGVERFAWRGLCAG